MTSLLVLQKDINICFFYVSDCPKDAEEVLEIS